MSNLKKIALGAVVWAIGIGLLHAWLNLGFNPIKALSPGNGGKVAEETRFRVGFLPVT